jgi:cytochrome b561
MASAADPAGQSAMHYSRVAMWFHWIIAALIVSNWLLGKFHEDFSRDVRVWMMLLHRSTGLTILALSVGRLLWRLGHRPPPFDEVLRPWEALLARTTHWLFYALMIALPITGWMLSSSGGRPLSYFGMFDFALLPVSRAASARALFKEMHEVLAYAMLALVILHMAGALKHHFQGHRQFFGRMGPWLYRR